MPNMRKVKHDDPVPKSKVSLYQIFTKVGLTQHSTCGDECTQREEERIAFEDAEQYFRDELVYEIEGLMCDYSCPDGNKETDDFYRCALRNAVIQKAARFAKGKGDYSIHI